MKRNIIIVGFIVATCIASLSAMEIELAETTLDMIQEQKTRMLQVEDQDNATINSVSDHINCLYSKGEEICCLPKDTYKNCTYKDVCKVCVVASGAGLVTFGILEALYAAIGACTLPGAKFACNPCILATSAFGGCSVCSGINCVHGYKYSATWY